MSTIENPKDHPTGNAEKDPDDWTTGDDEQVQTAGGSLNLFMMTGAQASYLKTLSEEAHTDFDDGLTKAEASKRIDALQEKTGRGADR